MANLATASIETIPLSEVALIVRPVLITGTETIASAGTFFKCDATSGAFPLTLPSAALNAGRVLAIKKSDVSANAVTVTRAGSDTIDGATTHVLSAQYNFVVLINDEDGDIWNIIASG